MNSKHTLHAVLIVAGLALGSMLTACIHDSNASSNGNVSAIRIMAVSTGKAVSRVEHRVVNGIGTEVTAFPQQVSAVSNGTVLGTVMNSDPFNSPDVTIQTDLGIMYRANQNTGDVDPLTDLYFATRDCTGQAYAIVGDGPGDSIPTAIFNNGGSAFTLQDGSVGMVLKTDTAVSVNILSGLHNNGTCNPLSFTNATFYQVNPNVTTSTHLAGANVGAFTYGGL